MPDNLERGVIEDLRYLSQVWNSSHIREEDIRRTSNTMRLLLIDEGGSLSKIARHYKVNIEVLAPINQQTIRMIKGHDNFYLCGHTESWGG